MLPNEAYNGERPWSSIQIMEFTKKMDMFPNLLLAYKILLTLPVTVATVERSFSNLKILKSYLRSTMSQERLNGLAILSIESRFLTNVDYDKDTHPILQQRVLFKVFGRRGYNGIRKIQFDEIPDTEREQQSVKEQFRTDYFLVIVGMALVQLKSTFEQMEYFESIFGFMFDASKLSYLDDANLKKCCLNLESALTNDEDCDIDVHPFYFEKNRHGNENEKNVDDDLENRVLQPGLDKLEFQQQLLQLE
ncbi:hypothetical protein CTI12_AA373780 [Artemisia annua]|uniref:HAT C-terminal dimerisation domain-containing protein n=1 Tax=Artemisia annua TaxID=35608 RepID=A0A2U1M2Q2_ARTAN|nr:hypothetical protein CTI12_AA373780 [Artemisia annua]